MFVLDSPIRIITGDPLLIFVWVPNIVLVKFPRQQPCKFAIGVWVIRVISLAFFLHLPLPLPFQHNLIFEVIFS